MENKKKLVKSGNNYKSNALYGLIYTLTASVCIILFGLIFSVVYGGYEKIDWHFLSTPTEPKTVMTTFEAHQTYDFDIETIKTEKNVVYTIENVTSQGEILNSNQESIKLEQGIEIRKINYNALDKMEEAEAEKELKNLQNPTEDIKVSLTYPGGGIRTLIVTTLFVVLISLMIAVPFGIFAAVYLIEYQINQKLDRIIHFSIDSLAGIPSVIFGLFGSVFFSVTLQMGASLIAGILTVSIMLLPIIIKTVEEALLGVPQSFREASFGLGANQTQTIFRVIIPAAIPGIIVAIILSIGRVIGETAIFVFVVGTSVANPTLFGKGSTLTVYAYNITRESLDYQTACAIGIIIIVIIVALNLLAKYISKKITR